MINRNLIRIKVVQMAYSYFLTESERTVIDAKNELEKSLDKSYELYNALLVLAIELTQLQDQKLDAAKHKYLPTEEDLNPNTRFIENQLVEKLKSNESLNSYLSDNPISWFEHDIFMKNMLDKITSSDIYTDYMEMPMTDFKSDCALWRALFKKVIFVDEDFLELLESESVFWNDDLDTVGNFAIKTIKRIEDGITETLMPMYKDTIDSEYAPTLFAHAVKFKNEYNELIDKFVQKDSWDAERLAFMDRAIMVVAISELVKFPDIPTTVTLNEYIEIAKYYSTNKSGQFINGMLHSIINHLKSEGKLFKN
ncbi:MAG: transcription antitermination protein NusB [Bacteroidales bacterium]